MSPLLRLVLCCVVCACVGLAACGSAKETDWDARVGVYTYDDAVKDMGQPQACTDQPDGGRVCSWDVSGAFKYVDQHLLKFDAAGRLVSQRKAKFR